jgi:hypothetical protein
MTKQVILTFMSQWPVLMDQVEQKYGQDLPSEQQQVDYLMELNYQLLGMPQENYYSRVCGSCLVTYSPEDVQVMNVTF